MEELDLKEIFQVFWNKKIDILIVVFIFLVVGVIYSFMFNEPKYKSSTKLLLAKASQAEETSTETSITQTELTLNQKLVSTYSELIESKSVLREVIANLSINGLDESNLRNSITVSSVKDTEVIEITVVNENPNHAAEVANEIARVFSKKVAEIYNINNVYVVDMAEADNVPYNINHIKDILIFIFIGLVIAIVYVFIVNMLDTTIKTEQDVEKATGLLVLASIPIYDFENKKGGNRR